MNDNHDYLDERHLAMSDNTSDYKVYNFEVVCNDVHFDGSAMAWLMPNMTWVTIRAHCLVGNVPALLSGEACLVFKIENGVVDKIETMEGINNPVQLRCAASIMFKLALMELLQKVARDVWGDIKDKVIAMTKEEQIEQSRHQRWIGINADLNDKPKGTLN